MNKVFISLTDTGVKRQCPFRPGSITVGSHDCTRDCKSFLGRRGTGLGAWVNCASFNEEPERFEASYHETLPNDHKVIQAAVDAGDEVYAGNLNYRVIKDRIGQYLIHSQCNDHYVGLSGREGTDAEGKLNMDSFFKIVKCNFHSALNFTKMYNVAVCFSTCTANVKEICEELKIAAFYSEELLTSFLEKKMDDEDKPHGVLALPIDTFSDDINSGKLNLMELTVVFTSVVMEDK